KYNIPPELYKPHKNPYGDYPDLGIFSQQRRDPHYPWDDYVNRRDWGEFVDLRFNLHSEDRCDPLFEQSLGYSPRFM
ncbi:hypothetical protein INO48_14310, partial [Staphylococcus aureus]|nr:hypothetical protein [Staphylococcus aureus]